MKMRKLHAIKVVMATAMFIGTAPYLCVTAATETEAGSEAAEIEAAGETAETEADSEAGEAASAGLPAFVYNEDSPDSSPYLAAICAYLAAEFGNGSGEVMIPAPVILYTDDSDAENVRVWGNFWTLGYSLEGTCLVCEGGGEAPGIMELTQAGDGRYEVTDFRMAGDGTKYAEDIRSFCEEAEGEEAEGEEAEREEAEGEKAEGLDADTLYEQYMQSNDLSASPAADVRKAFIAQYVEDNDLDIDSFQDPGWDPIELEDPRMAHRWKPSH